MNDFLGEIRQDAPFIIMGLVFLCAYYLERIKVKIDAIHYIMVSKTYPDALKD